MGRNRTNYSSKYKTYDEDPVIEIEEVENDVEAETSEYREDATSEIEEMTDGGKIVVLGKVDVPENCNLNVRADKSQDSEAITTINRHSEIVIVDGEFDDSDWYKICTASGIEGYVLKKFISNVHNELV